MHFAKIREQKYKNNTKKMVKEKENFKQSLIEMQEFLSTRKQMGNLAKESGTSLRTVYDTFAVNSFNDLKGKLLIVYRTAIKMIKEIKSLPEQANQALK